MKNLRAKKDGAERLINEQRKKELEEKLEEYYISLKNLENFETDIGDIKKEEKSKLKKGFFYYRSFILLIIIFIIFKSIA
jgi:hypothetical protein